MAIRTLAVAARNLPSPPTPDVLSAIVTARAAGGRAIIPVADPPPTAPRDIAVGLATAATMALLAAVTFGLLIPLKASERGGLRFEPPNPVPGSALRVVYRSSEAFRGHDRLVLRARFRNAGELREEPTAVVTAILRRTTPGEWVGSMILADSAVYGAFVVEDSSGHVMDSNARQPWELLVHDAEGRPSLEALEQRRIDLLERDWNGAYSTAQAAVRLHPARAAAWLGLRSLQLNAATSGRELDSVGAWYRDRFHLLERSRPSALAMSGDELAWMFWYAASVKDSASYAYWRDRLISEAPIHYRAVQLRAIEFLSLHRHEPDTVLVEFDKLWDSGLPLHWQVRWHALRAAVTLGRLDEVRTWGDRLAMVAPRRVLRLAIESVDDPAMRPAALQLLRMLLAALERPHRDLMRTLPQQEAADRLIRARLLAGIGRGLAEDGDFRGASEHLEAANAWDPEVFSLLAQGYLKLGDTDKAVEMLARLAAEPGLPVDSTWSLRRSAERLLADSGWVRRVERARHEMIELTQAGSLLEPVPYLPLLALDGSKTSLATAAVGERPTVIALWSRYRTAADVELSHLAELQEWLSGTARVVVITVDGPADQLRKHLAELGTGLLVFLVARADFVRAFASMGSPEYSVLDAQLRLRFRGALYEDLPRQVEALNAERASMARSGW